MKILSNTSLGFIIVALGCQRVLPFCYHHYPSRVAASPFSRPSPLAINALKSSSLRGGNEMQRSSIPSSRIRYGVKIRASVGIAATPAVARPSISPPSLGQGDVSSRDDEEKNEQQQLSSMAAPPTPSAGMAREDRLRKLRQLEKQLASIKDAGRSADFELYQNGLRSCAKLGDVSTALKLLRRLQQCGSTKSSRSSLPPRVAYNLVLEAATNAMDSKVALELYEEMVGPNGVGSNVFTYGPLLSLYAKMGDGHAAIKLLAEMDRFNINGNVFTYTAAIDACERAGLVEMTKRLMEEMGDKGVKPTAVTYNTIIARRAEKAETWTEALDWLKKLESSGLQPTRSSYAAALNACERANEWELVVELTERAGALADTTMWSRQLSALIKLERYDDVLETLKRLRSEQKVPVDEVMYTVALKACALGRRFQEVQHTLIDMKEAGLTPNVVTFSAAMEACRGEGNWEMALDLLEEMKYQDVKPNTVTYSILLDLLAEAGQWQRALHLFMSLDKEGVPKTVWLYTAAIRACAKGQQLESAMALLREVTSSPSMRSSVNLCLYTAALDACEKVGDGSLALQLLDEMHRDHGIVVDDVACGVVISACRKAGMAADCLRLLAFMVSHRLAPNIGVYNTVLGALCGQPEYLDKAMEILAYVKLKKTNGPKPNAQSYSQVINALADDLRWKEALTLLSEMRQAGHRPEVLTCAKVIAACERKQQWKQALQLLDEMRKDKYDFYELELLDQVFKKLVGVAAAGMRSILKPEIPSSDAVPCNDADAVLLKAATIQEGHEDRIQLK